MDNLAAWQLVLLFMLGICLGRLMGYILMKVMMAGRKLFDRDNPSV